MKPLYKGLLLVAIQVALVVSLGVKLLHDRATCPRVWVRAAPFDPDLPIRGRYVSLRLEVPAEGFTAETQASFGQRASLKVENGQLAALATDSTNGSLVRIRTVNGMLVADLFEPVAFFIPEHVPDPSRRPPGEELWVEVTMPRKGPPRPIRLGVKKEGVLTPLNLD